MELVALTGKPRSGKTTLSKALEKQGYVLINFTDSLKQEVRDILYDYGVGITVEQINSDKETYRGLLQEVGKHIQFDTNPFWVNQSLKQWLYTCTWDGGYANAVFDNVRTPQQLDVLKSYGFKLVRLFSNRSEAEWLTVATGYYYGLPASFQHPVESALDHVKADLELNGDLSVEDLVNQILNS